MTRGNKKHHVGHYFILRFDSSTTTQDEVRKLLGVEPRMLRFSVVKLGQSLKELARWGGETEEWGDRDGGRGAQRDRGEELAQFDAQVGDMESGEARFRKDLLGGVD
jgi:Ribosomal protein S6